MSISKETKINLFLQDQPKGIVWTTAWLVEGGISYSLQQRYKKSGWLESLGTGAYIRKSDTVTWHGALYALQTQCHLDLHPGGITALTLQGYAHYIRMGGETLHIFGTKTEARPMWFKNYDWGIAIVAHTTSFLPKDLGLISFEYKDFSLRISSPERAILECLLLAPLDMDLIECYHLMEGLGNLNPKLLQELLEVCRSVKVKRLFLYIADKNNHQWIKFINKEKIDLGRGKRSLEKNGVYIPAYQITVPKALEDA